jgi:hypothetical protein
MCASGSLESIPIGEDSSGGDNPDVSKEAGMSSAFPSSLAASVLFSAAALAAEPDLRIVSAAAASLRESPGTSSATIGRLPLGTLVEERARTGGVDTVGGETAPWLLVATPSGEEGWLFGALTLPYAEAERDALAVEIADGRLKRERDPFESFVELHAFLSRAAAAAGSPEAGGRLGLSALRALDRTAGAIGVRRLHEPKVLAWVEANARDLVWSEPGARWLVVADRYWELHERFFAVPAAEEIAWDAARALLPGECEGEIPCHVGVVARTYGRYLGLWPKGAHASAALSRVATEVDALAEDPRTRDLAGSVPTAEIDALRKDLGTLKRVLAPIADPRAAAAAATLDALLERLAPGAGARS